MGNDFSGQKTQPAVSKYWRNTQNTQLTRKYNKHTYKHKNTANPLVYTNMGWLGDGSHKAGLPGLNGGGAAAAVPPWIEVDQYLTIKVVAYVVSGFITKWTSLIVRSFSSIDRKCQVNDDDNNNGLAWIEYVVLTVRWTFSLFTCESLWQRLLDASSLVLKQKLSDETVSRACQPLDSTTCKQGSTAPAVASLMSIIRWALLPPGTGWVTLSSRDMSDRCTISDK